MEKKFIKEEFLENLPDYINHSIDDDILRKEIQTEIETNPDFKKEFELLKSTLNTINNFELSKPPENYFNSLLPRINEKIYNKPERFGFLKNLSVLWKLAVPVVTIIVFFISYKTFFENNEYTNRLNKNSIVLNNDTQISNKSNDTVFGNPEEKKSLLSENFESEYAINPDKTIGTNTTENKSNSYNKKNSNSTNITNISENIPDEELFYSTDDDDAYEQDFDKLSSEEQNNIISKIKNSNL